MEATAKRKSAPSGAVDLGSNSFRLLIGFVNGKDIEPLVKELVTTRLAGGLDKTGSLAPEAVNSSLETLASFRSQLDRHGVKSCACCGTEALRRAVNSREFVDKAMVILGCEVEVISGIREAELSCSGALAGLGGSYSPPVFIVDVGGGSTEFSFIEKIGTQPRSVSLLAGAVALSENDERYMAEIFARMHEQLEEFLVGIAGWRKTGLIATGGTATTIAMLDQQLDIYDEQKVHGYAVQTTSLDRLTASLSRMSPAERNKFPGLEDGRGEIIVAGCKIYQEIIATIGVDGMIVSDWGLLEGILLDANIP